MKLRILSKEDGETIATVGSISEVERYILPRIKLNSAALEGIFFKVVMDYSYPNLLGKSDSAIRMYEIIASIRHSRSDTMRTLTNVFCGYLEEEVENG